METDKIGLPLPRSGHIGVAYDNYIFVWGGYHEVASGDAYIPTDMLYIYHTEMQLWHKQKTKGEPPPGTSGAAAIIVNHDLFILFGHTYDGNSNAVWRLNLRTWMWSKVPAADTRVPSPRDKFTAWLYKNKIYVFGGFGLPLQDYLNDNGEFCYDNTTWPALRGWNNQLHILDLETLSWENPSCKGCVPSARAAHATARLGPHVYLFGGRHESLRLNDLHCIHLPSLTWCGSLLSAGPVPCGRSWHSLTPASESHLILYGGYSQENQPLDDCWQLDVGSLHWCQLTVQRGPRLWHTACSTADGAVVIFGGCKSDILNQEQPTHHSREVIILRTTPLTLLRISLERVFILRKTTQSQWDTLPKTLGKRLKDRKLLLEHGNENGDTNADTLDGHASLTQMCCVC